MSDFVLDGERNAIREMARAFANDKIAPHAIEWDTNKHFPVDVIRKALFWAWAESMSAMTLADPR